MTHLPRPTGITEKQEVEVLAIEFKLSRDPQLLQQYYDLRERCYRKELGIPDFDGSEDADDQRGRILLAIENGRCIGGARVSPRVHLPSLSAISAPG